MRRAEKRRRLFAAAQLEAAAKKLDAIRASISKEIVKCPTEYRAELRIEQNAYATAAKSIRARENLLRDFSKAVPT